MISGIVATLAIIAFVLFFVVYKRDMLVKMFSINATSSATQLQTQLEQTADAVIARLERETVQLQQALTKAETVISELEERNRAAEAVLQQLNTKMMQAAKITLPAEPAPVMPEVVGAPLQHTPEGNSESKATQPEEDAALRRDGEAGGDDKRQLILAMAEQGYSITDIAKATGRGKGEILLLMQLHKTK